MSNLPSFIPSTTNVNEVHVIYPNGQSTDASLIKYGQLLQSDNTITPWIDTKLFPILQVTSSLTTDSCAHIFWGIGSEDNEPDNYALDKDTITSSRTTEWDSRARWARILLQGTGTLSYVFKPTPTGIKLVDNSGSIVSVSSNAMQIVYRDAGGVLGNTDESSTGNALYTSLTDINGRPLAKVIDALAVGIRDNCGENISSTGVSGDQLLLNGYDRTALDIVFFMDLSGMDEANDKVDLGGTYTISGSFVNNPPILTVDSVTANGFPASVSDLRPGFLFPQGNWIAAIDGSDITVSGQQSSNIGAGEPPGQYTIEEQTTIGHFINYIIYAITAVDDIYGNAVRYAFVSNDLSIDFTGDVSAFMEHLESSMYLLHHSNGAANNIYGKINSFRNEGYDHQDKESRALVLAYNDIEDADVTLTTSFSRISVAYVNNGGAAPSGITGLTAGNTGEGSIYTVNTSDVTEPLALVDILYDTVTVVYGDLYHSNNALAIVPTDICGHSQASVVDTHGTQRFGGNTALCYALADVSGVRIGTTNALTNNALYVHLTDHSGQSISTTNPLPITLGGNQTVGLVVDTSVGDTLTSFIDVNSSDISGYSFNLGSLNLSNETAVPVWFKIYDTHDGIAAYSRETNNYAAAQHTLKLNVAVPPLSTRDLQINKGIVFNHGLAARVSTKHQYDASTDGNIGTQAQTFLTAHHIKVTSDVQRTANVAARPEPNIDGIRAFDVDRNGVSLRGYLNTITNTDGKVSQVLFMPLEATGITNTHDDITLTLKDLSGDTISLTDSVSYSTLYNSPLIAGGPKLLTLSTSEDLSAYTVVVGLNSTDNSFAHIAHVVGDTDMSLVSITRYGTNGAFQISSNRDTGNSEIRTYNVTSRGPDTDISQVDLFYSGLGGTLASYDGSTTDHSATIISSFPITTNLIDLSAYLITYDASVYIVSTNNTVTQQYLHNTEINDASTNRWSYFGISADHVDGSNWCFSTHNMVGYVYNNDSDTWRTSIARYDRNYNSTQVDVSYHENNTLLNAVTVSGVYEHTDGFKVSYYDAVTGNYSSVNRVVIWWGDVSYDFSLNDLGGSHKYITAT